MTEEPLTRVKTAQAKLEVLREHLQQHLYEACLHGGTAQSMLQIQDDDAVIFSFRRMVHHVREAAMTANEITALKAGPSDG